MPDQMSSSLGGSPLSDDSSVLAPLVHAQGKQITELRSDLHESVDSIRHSISKLSSDLADRQERAHGRQWPLMLSGAGVLIALGALVSGGFYRDIGRLEAHSISLEDKNDERETRLSGVAHNAASAVVGLGELKEKMQQMDRDIRSLEYRTTKGERIP